MHRILPPAVAVLSVLVVVSVPFAMAASQQFILAPGDMLTVTCTTQLSGTINANQAQLTCAANPTATPSPTATVAPPPTLTATPVPPGIQPPVAGQPCPQWVHDAYITTGPDGKTYPTWHPPVDPRYGCLFGHEHGADPRTSHASNTMPPFGYAAATMGMVEPHAGFKVFVMNAGQTVESNISNKVADEDTRFVFHMGTGGVARYSTQFHSFQLDYIDRSGSGRFAHLFGMTDTGPTSKDGSTCDNPRQGAKDFSALNCPDTYEIWNATRFQIIHPSDPYQGLLETRFAMVPSFAVFDPITTRDPSDNSRLIYTQSVKGQSGVDPTSTQADFQGCAREFYSGPFYWHNAGMQTVYFTDAMGHVAPTGPDASHPIRQEISSATGSRTVIYKARTDYCGNGIHTPN